MSSLKPMVNPPPGSKDLGTVPAQLAYDCLKSIPINGSAALELVRTVRPYLNFQSTLGFLKNPTWEYRTKIQEPADLMGDLDRIAGKIQGGEYDSEYDVSFFLGRIRLTRQFGVDMYTTMQSAHDGHLWFTPDSVAGLFRWGRPLPLVSISSDGDEIPAIFAYNDVLLATQDSSFEPSPIVQINGGDAIEYLLTIAQLSASQDRDACWNDVFFSLPNVALGGAGSAVGAFAGGGRGSVVWPGASTDVTFDNGTTITIETTARVRKDFTGITNGQDVYNKYFSYPDQTVDLMNIDANYTSDPRYPFSKKAAEKKDQTQVAAPGYPTALVRLPGNEVGGYYLNGTGYDNVAVLAMASFEPSCGEQCFQDATRKFLVQAKKDGKTKLIIDVSANGGGIIMLGYEIFLELFPGITPFGGSRFRAHQAYDEMGIAYSAITANDTRDPNSADSDYIGSPLNYRSDLTLDNTPFQSWADKYGPHEYNDDQYTTPQRWNLNDSYITEYSGLTQMTGYGLASLDISYSKDDVVIMYDGTCASTCTIFSEFMRQQVGVQVIAMGGRPNDDIIQAVGGTKGANNWGWSDLMTTALDLYARSDPAMRAQWQQGEMAQLNSYLPFKRTYDGNPQLNMRDAVREGDDSGVPLQFKYEPADCRLYYTADMMIDMGAMWRAAADAKWLGTADCAAGEFRGSDDDDKRKMVKRAARATTKSFKVKSVSAEKVDALKASLALTTEFELSKAGANH
jgi:hypothetical protein